MKWLFLSALIAMNMMAKAAVNIDRIDPAYWFAGMKDASLQLMVYGKDIRNCTVTAGNQVLK